jgi:hypothetical protein
MRDGEEGREHPVRGSERVREQRGKVPDGEAGGTGGLPPAMNPLPVGVRVASIRGT